MSGPIIDPNVAINAYNNTQNIGKTAAGGGT